MSKFRLLSLMVVFAIVLAAWTAAAPTAAPAQPTTPPAQNQTAPTTAPRQPQPRLHLQRPRRNPPRLPPRSWRPSWWLAGAGPSTTTLVVAAAYTQATGNQVTVEEIAPEVYQDKLTTTFVAGGSDYDVAYVLRIGRPPGSRPTRFKISTSISMIPKWSIRISISRIISRPSTPLSLMARPMLPLRRRHGLDVVSQGSLGRQSIKVPHDLG